MSQLLKTGVLLIVFIFSVSSLMAAQRYDFESFVTHAFEHSGAMKIAEAEIKKANSKEEEVFSRRMFKGELTALGSIVPEATGNAVNGDTDSSRWGPLFDVSLKIYQPIFAFGASVDGKKGAQAGINAQKKLLEKEKWQLRYEIAELFYAYQLSFDLLVLADDFEKKIQKAYDAAQKKAKKTEADQINVYLQDIKIKKLEAETKRKQIRSAMAWKAGMSSADEARWARANLKKRKFFLKELSFYLAQVKKTRPEWEALSLESTARKYAYRAHKKLIWPQFFVGAKVEYAAASVRENQESPFAHDPYNKFSGAVGLGARWDLSFWEKSAKVSKLRAESLKANAKESYYKKGILVDVEKNFLELQQLQKAEELSLEALKSARHVLRDHLTAYEVKSVKFSQLKDSLLAYGLKKKEYLELLYQHNLLSVKFEQSIGLKL